MGLQPPDPGGSSYSSAKPTAHNGQSGPEELRKSTWSPSLLGLLVLAAPFLEVLHLSTTVPSASQLREGLGLSSEIFKDKGKGGLLGSAPGSPTWEQEISLISLSWVWETGLFPQHVEFL